MYDAFNTVVFYYPDTGAVKFLFWMLGVMALAIWVGIREDRQ